MAAPRAGQAPTLTRHVPGDMSMELLLDAHLITDRGRRERNEDRCGAFTPEDQDARATRGRLFIVADGMGGHLGGDVAAELTLREVPERYFQGAWSGAEQNLRTAFLAANQAISAEATSDPARQGMGAAAVAAAVIGDHAVLAHLGDCRAYRLRNGEAELMTLDHSWVQERVRAGRISEDEARVHPYRNVLTRALGAESDVEPTMSDVDFRAGDLLLLCSDGLWGLVEDSELAEVAHRFRDARGVARALVDLALERGGADNVSVAVIRALPPENKAPTLKSSVAPTQRMDAPENGAIGERHTAEHPR